MTQYIPKSEVVTEIEKKLQDLIACKENTSFTEHKVVLWAKIDMCKEILSFLNTIEAKKVDLDEEIRKEIDKYYDECEKKLYKMKDDDTDISFLQLDSFAKHFFELGLKASNPITATDRGTAEEIIISLKRVEQDYHIDLTREMEWVRNKVKKEK
jgi:hypothetical protein